jgi:hypothetical protein
VSTNIPVLMNLVLGTWKTKGSEIYNNNLRCQTRLGYFELRPKIANVDSAVTFALGRMFWNLELGLINHPNSALNLGCAPSCNVSGISSLLCITKSLRAGDVSASNLFDRVGQLPCVRIENWEL